MGFSSDQIIQIGLNFAGFVTAGLLTAVIYSIWADYRKMSRPALTNTGEIALPKGPAPTIAPEEKKTIEFIDFKENGTKSRKSHRSAPKPPASNSQVRDRQEIIRLAKEMLAERKSNTEIRRTLKVTNGELSFLKQNLNLQGIVRNR